MKILLKGIPLDQISVSMTMSGAIIPIMAFFIIAAQEQGVSPNQLRGTIQNDILKEFMVRNTYIYPPIPSMQIIADIFKYTSLKMPKFNSISISGYHMHEAGATSELEIAFTLANGLEYVKTGIKAGINIDDFAPRLSFFWGIGMDFFKEIAKMRAARVLWAKIIYEFNPKNDKSMALRTHCQTSGYSLTAQLPYNNITRTTVEALAAVLGHTQSLHTNALDEALALPTDFSAEIARNTQLFLQNKKVGITHSVDPLGGSAYVESITEKLILDAWKIIQEIEGMGGMTKAIVQGYPKRKIEEVATHKQARIDTGKEIIVGLNKYHHQEKMQFEIRKIDNEKVRKNQIERLKYIKSERNNPACQKALKKLEKNAKANTNILESALVAAKERATLAEISFALEKVYGRYKATNHLISGVYSSMSRTEKDFQKARKLSDEFAELDGRRPRILIAKMGQDGHDRGARVVASSFADMGFDVDIGPLFQTPWEIAKQAIENDVHMVGVSSLAGCHDTLLPELIEELKKVSGEEILVIAGGIIPSQDHAKLLKAGVSYIFGPGTIISKAAIQILNILLNKKSRRQEHT